MKFYYNGNLVRTSKTRHYKYAVGTSDTATYARCCETFASAQKALDELKRQIIKVAESNYKFAQNPENLAWLKERYGEQFDAEERYKKAIARVQFAEIVELEER